FKTLKCECIPASVPSPDFSIKINKHNHQSLPPHRRLSPLQSIMNAAARLIHLTNRSVSATPLCQSLHCPPLSVLHPSLSIPPLASTQCPPPLSANPSTGLHSVSSIPLCQSLHWPPLSVLHPSLPTPPLASPQCPPSLSANSSTGLTSVSSTPLCQS
ncbi:unnamed protein product, partial [Staurois parvus]